MVGHQRLLPADRAVHEPTIREADHAPRIPALIQHYALTDDGRAELADWLADLLRQPAKEYPRFAAGLSFATRLPSAEVAALLEERARFLEEAVRASRALFENLLLGGLPRRVLIEQEYELALQEAELRWVGDLVRDLRSGELTWEGYLS